MLGRDHIKKTGLIIVAVSRPLSLMRSGYPHYFGSLLLSLSHTINQDLCVFYTPIIPRLVIPTEEGSPQYYSTK
jgi:hypothetical protein